MARTAAEIQAELTIFETARNKILNGAVKRWSYAGRSFEYEDLPYLDGRVMELRKELESLTSTRQHVAIFRGRR